MGGTLDYREELAKQLKEDMAGAKYDTVYKLEITTVLYKFLKFCRKIR